MAASATLRHARITPRKMRVVCDAVRGKKVQDALDFLTFSRRGAAKPLLKLVRSAVANADRKGGMNVERLYVRRILCDQGTSLKRWLPRARGSASPILKRTCHVFVELDEK